MKIRPHLYPVAALALLAFLIPGLFRTARPTQAMPPFAQAYGAKCSLCHVMVPMLNAYGRYIQRTSYSSLDRQALSSALPIWIGENANYDSTQGAPSNLPRYQFGNLALHAVGYLAPDITYHAQQWITQNNQPGGVDTLWVTYNNLLHRDGHLSIGKIQNPAPGPYNQPLDIDGPSASSTVVGEHDWAATYGNRWGAKLAYVHKAVYVEAGYFLSGDDLNGITDFNPGDKTFQWKVANARATVPLEYGLFGSIGALPVTTGTDRYTSTAAYVQVDPSSNGMPGVLAIYQLEKDSNPGLDASSNPLPATTSRGASAELFESLAKGEVVLGVRHDFNNDGISAIGVGNTINVGFNVPHLQYVHGYLESRMGASSSLAGASSGPTWKGMLWLTFPIRNSSDGKY